MRKCSHWYKRVSRIFRSGMVLSYFFKKNLLSYILVSNNFNYSLYECIVVRSIKLYPLHKSCFVAKGTISNQKFNQYKLPLMSFLYFNFIFILRTSVLFYTCFGLLVTSALDIKVRVDPLACVLCCLHIMESSDSPLVRHLLTSWQPA